MKAYRTFEGVPLQCWELVHRPWGFYPAFRSYVYTYRGALIDCGSAHNQTTVEQILAQTDIQTCLLTHHHEDHAGNIALLNQSGIPVYLHPAGKRLLEESETLSFTSKWAYGQVEPGMLLDLNPQQVLTDHGLLVMETPGHSEDHIVFYDSEHGILFSGDLYLGPNIPFFRSDELIVESIQSLRRVLNLDFDILCCAHQPVFKGGKQALKDKLEFLETIYYKTRKYYHQGYNKKAILKRLPIRENYFRKYFSGGMFSAINMVSSVIRDEQKSLFGHYLKQNLMDPKKLKKPVVDQSLTHL